MAAGRRIGGDIDIIELEIGTSANAKVNSEATGIGMPATKMLFGGGHAGCSPTMRQRRPPTRRGTERKLGQRHAWLFLF